MVHALQKLFMGVQENCAPESPDHVMLQEVLLGGHLCLQLIREQLCRWMTTTRYAVMKKMKTDGAKPLTQGEKLSQSGVV